MARISREALNIQIARLISMRGTCKRLQVGAVITCDNMIVATGYNGPRAEEDHCQEANCDLSKPCSISVHAEINAIKALYRTGIINHKTKTFKLYVTHQPCYECSNEILMIAPVIKEVYYLEPFRDSSGVELLKKYGVKVYQIDEEGQTINTH